MFGGGSKDPATNTRRISSPSESQRFAAAVDMNNLIAPKATVSSSKSSTDFPKYALQKPGDVEASNPRVDIMLNDPVVACLKQQQSKTSSSKAAPGSSSTPQGTAGNTAEETAQPYTAIALSPCHNYALTACKGTLQILRVSPSGLRVVKTIVAAQYFQVSLTTTSGASPAGSTSMSGNSNIGTIMDSSLFTRAESNPAAPPASNTASNMINNVVITDVAWSNIPTTLSSSSINTANDPSKTIPDKDDTTRPTGGSSLPDIDGAKAKVTDYENYDSEMNNFHQNMPPHQQSPHLAETITSATTATPTIGPGSSVTDSSRVDYKKKQHPPNTDGHHHHQQRRKNQPYPIQAHSRGSLIAAAGSNGAIVVWNAELLLDQLNILPSKPSSKTVATSTSSFISDTSQHSQPQQDQLGGTTKNQQQATTSQSQQQHPTTPEAVLSQHFGRAVNRLAWHPKKHGLLLSASQDGTVILWERRRRVSQQNKQQQQSENNVSATTATDDTAVSSLLSTSPAGGGGGLLVTRSIGRSSSTSIRGGGMFSNLFGLSSSSSVKPNSTTTTSSSGVGAGGSLFTGSGSPMKARSAYQWQTRASYEPKSEAIRDIRWSPYYDDVFALVTISGSLIAYNMHLPARALVKMAAHSGDATTLDWHPLLPNVLATGGASDRSVKVWNLETFLSFLNNNASTKGNTMSYTTSTKDDYYNIYANTNTLNSRTDSVLSDSSGTESYNPTLSLGATSTFPYHSAASLRTGSSTSTSFLNISRHKGMPKNLLHVLSISASVTRLRWRPPAFDTSASRLPEEVDNTDCITEKDRHESMIAVATAPVKGASAGGSGMLALWSYRRPFMPLSVVEGHKEGAVTDFRWLDTPRADNTKLLSGIPHSFEKAQRASDLATISGILRHGTSDPAHEGLQYGAVNRDTDPVCGNSDDDPLVGIWQHVLSVGRDGRCLIQSFARGYRPISRVPPSCFAIGNLSPFHKGYGSLQILSVCQTVPSSAASDFLLTGLRRDSVTAKAPGIFREVPLQEKMAWGKDISSFSPNRLGGTRLPSTDPQIMFSVVDQGDLDEELVPVEDQEKAMIIGPEVVHMSRFAERYRFYTDGRCPSRVDLCLHNADVAGSLRCSSLSHMWRMVASLIKCARSNGLPDEISQPKNAMQFAILPTIRLLLEERAEAGDVQTCVALCEVLEVLTKEQTVRIPDLHINVVREWYLSYIDLLRDMCLFSHATFLIRSCKDPYINALNQQSTTLHESCPQCGKALLSNDGASRDQDIAARRLCKSCRRRVGLCFLCHQPVKGLYVWCPGCGHGGHLDHALQWFGGFGGKNLNEFCPTGCGHRCNMFHRMEGIPKDYVIDAKDFTGE